MQIPFQSSHSLRNPHKCRHFNWWPTIMMATLPLIFPIAAHAQVGGSPFDTGFTALEMLFTGTVARVAWGCPLG